MTLLLSDNEQRLSSPYDEEPHIANLFVPQLSVKEAVLVFGIFQQDGSLKASEILRNETILAKCSAQTSEAGLPASGQVRRLAGRRCAIRRSMPVIDDVRRIDLADPDGQNGLALSMDSITEICSYKPFKEGKHMTL
ncbi:hypothetical protein VMCG_02645 [Cytospora schulzeri]|uniref:Uncharacterized protein n=1 Tax=Cytospora schulzeri TaxID=448051 RepID=A0A423X201_9PEZI|nr:hypothetical protein VMCG_02645 [Valsa malicola]